MQISASYVDSNCFLENFSFLLWSLKTYMYWWKIKKIGHIWPPYGPLTETANTEETCGRNLCNNMNYPGVGHHPWKFHAIASETVNSEPTGVPTHAPPRHNSLPAPKVRGIRFAHVVKEGKLPTLSEMSTNKYIVDANRKLSTSSSGLKYS